MEPFWNILNRLMDYIGTLAVAILFAMLAFSVGYHIGFSSGLDTKVTWVGEKYTMKVTGKATKR